MARATAGTATKTRGVAFAQVRALASAPSKLVKSRA
jgi:hypothetical protein